MTTERLLATCWAIGCFFPGAIVAAENWPAWRGPEGNGVAPAGDYPVEFSDEQSVAWSVKLQGSGGSTPAVWGERIFLTAIVDSEDAVCCYNFQGEQLWQKKLGPGRAGKHRNATGANPSPVTDGEHVVVYYKSGTLAALDLNGEVRWKTNLQSTYGEDTLWWDLGTSPVLVDGKVVVAVMQAGESYLVAYDLASGEKLWRQLRVYERPEESDQAYTTPTVVEVDGQKQIVVWGADHLTGHDVKTGKKLWECGGFNPQDKGMQRVIASQAVGEGIAVVPHGRGDFLTGVRIDGQGDVTASNRIWEQSDFGADVPTPVIDGDQIYLLTDRGEIHQLALRDGEQLGHLALPRARDKYYASPVLAGDLLYCTREDGVVFVVRAGEKLELIAENDMDRQLIATPVPIRGGLLVRAPDELFWIVKSDRQ